MADNRREPQRPQMGPPGRGRGPRNLFVEKPKDFKGTLKKLMIYINYKKGIFWGIRI